MMRLFAMYAKRRMMMKEMKSLFAVFVWAPSIKRAMEAILWGRSYLLASGIVRGALSWRRTKQCSVQRLSVSCVPTSMVSWRRYQWVERRISGRILCASTGFQRYGLLTTSKNKASKGSCCCNDFNLRVSGATGRKELSFSVILRVVGKAIMSGVLVVQAISRAGSRWRNRWGKKTTVGTSPSSAQTTPLKATRYSIKKVQKQLQIRVEAARNLQSNLLPTIPMTSSKQKKN